VLNLDRRQFLLHLTALGAGSIVFVTDVGVARAAWPDGSVRHRNAGPGYPPQQFIDPVLLGGLIIFGGIASAKVAEFMSLARKVEAQLTGALKDLQTELTTLAEALVAAIEVLPALDNLEHAKSDFDEWQARSDRVAAFTSWDRAQDRAQSAYIAFQHRFSPPPGSNASETSSTIPLNQFLLLSAAMGTRMSIVVAGLPFFPDAARSVINTRRAEYIGWLEGVKPRLIAEAEEHLRYLHFAVRPGAPPEFVEPCPRPNPRPAPRPQPCTEEGCPEPPPQPGCTMPGTPHSYTVTWDNTATNSRTVLSHAEAPASSDFEQFAARGQAVFDRAFADAKTEAYKPIDELERTVVFWQSLG
jgi:hypothetical protein